MPKKDEDDKVNHGIMTKILGTTLKAPRVLATM
jgi:hypothetical protein